MLEYLFQIGFLAALALPPLALFVCAIVLAMPRLKAARPVVPAHVR
jgi:hypothetical protein